MYALQAEKPEELDKLEKLLGIESCTSIENSLPVPTMMCSSSEIEQAPEITSNNQQQNKGRSNLLTMFLMLNRAMAGHYSIWNLSQSIHLSIYPTFAAT